MVISPKNWREGLEFIAHCRASDMTFQWRCLFIILSWIVPNLILVPNYHFRQRVTKEWDNCGTAAFIGVSPRLLYCGSYDDVLAGCVRDKDGYVIISRWALSNGDVCRHSLPKVRKTSL